MSHARALATTLLASLVLVAGVLREVDSAEIELVASGNFSGTARDLSGLTDELGPGMPHDRLGGFSALEYSGQGNRYYALPDRGPADGAVPYRCRFQVLDLELPASLPKGKTGELKLTLRETHFFEDGKGAPLSGAAADFESGRRFDPEAIRLGRNGHLFVSDEYGPVIFEFSPKGLKVQSLTVPKHFLIAHPSASKDEEAEKNSSGRQANGGMEGLAISPDGSTLIGIMQRPLIQDSVPKKNGKRSGRNIRVLTVAPATGKTQEFVYQLDNEKNGISEILAISPDEFLVLERDGEIGPDANFKKITRIKTSGATDVSGLDKLPPEQLPAEIHPVKKSDFIDLLDPRFGLVGDAFPEKIEGLAFGPTLPDGRRLLMVAVDNDFIAEKPSWIYAFAIDPKLLPGFGWK